MLVDSIYFRACFEKRKHIWNKGYYSQKIADHARGGHSHEELIFDPEVIAQYLKYASKTPDQLPLVVKIAYFTQEPVCFSSSERDKGVRFKDFMDVFKHPIKWDKIGITDDLDLAVEMLSFCIKQDGKKYDWAGVSGFKLSFISQDQEKWYCSEVCDKAKFHVGLFPDFYASHPSDSYRTQMFIHQKGIK